MRRYVTCTIKCYMIKNVPMSNKNPGYHSACTIFLAPPPHRTEKTSLHLPLLDGRDVASRIVPHENPIPTPTPVAATPIPHLPAHVPARSDLPQHFLLVRHLPRMLVAGNAPIVPVVVLKRIRLFAMDGVVADLAHFVRHAEGDAADEFDEHHDERGPDDIPADDEEGADDLEADLAAVACDGAAGVGDAEGFAASFCGPQTCKREIF